MSEAIPEMLCFVGKWGQEIEGHPLVYHLIDSASFAELLWQQGLTPGARHQLCEWLQLSEDDCGRLLAFWTSLHDLGKATPSFQARHAPSKDRLSGLGFDFPLLAQKDIRHHSLLSQWILRDLREVLDILQPRFLNLLRFAIGGHHGTFHIQEDQEEDLAKDNNLGGPRWKAARQNLTETLRKLLAPPVFVPQPMN